MLILWFQRHPRLVDWALFLLALATSGGAAYHQGHAAVGVPLAAIACIPLLGRRRWPLPVLAITTAATIIQIAAWGIYNPLPAGIALFTVADQADRRTALAALGITLAVLTPAVWGDVGAKHVLLLFGRLLPFAVAWLIGDSIGTRRRYVGTLEERAERLEREREAEAARAVAEEQARIARELHDVIAHSLSVIVVQAAAADDVFDARPDRVRQSLRAIETTGRAALEELRTLIGSVRGDQASYAPTPGLADLDALIEQVQTAGLAVTVTIEGEPSPLPQAVDLSAYRVAQEALTNTLKHANASRAEIALRWHDDQLDLEIHDDGAGSTANGPGHGIVGMRERLVALGGTLAAGPAAGGGFTVLARFPVGASP
jgi:signal transduction histidine kinase